MLPGENLAKRNALRIFVANFETKFDTFNFVRHGKRSDASKIYTFVRERNLILKKWNL